MIPIDRGEHDGVIGARGHRRRSARSPDFAGPDVARGVRFRPVSLGYLSEVERGRKEPSSELLNAICDALQVPLSQVLTDAGERMAREEHAAALAAPASRASIDVSTKVVIPQVASLAVA